VARSRNWPGDGGGVEEDGQHEDGGHQPGGEGDHLETIGIDHHQALPFTFEMTPVLNLGDEIGWQTAM
jgi:hypothetical protein